MTATETPTAVTSPEHETTNDVAIIGAGVVGCAMARRLTLDGARVVLIEKGADVLSGASKGNSAILHTGFDAPPGSQEQQCVKAGHAEYLTVAEEMGLPILKSGALVLAWDETQLETLPSLIDKAHKNGVMDVKMLSREDILKREPHLSDKLLGGFEVPREYLIDPWTSAHAYIHQAVLNGATLLTDTEVTGGRFTENLWHLDTNHGTISARQVINCAGLYGDRVDETLLGQHDFTITPRKGQFVVFDKVASDLASAILLPVPTKKTKGIVICRTIFGNLLVGPTAEDQQSRTDASTERQTLMMLRDRGIEMIPDLAQCEVTTAYAGLRPASEFQDFQITIHSDRNYVSVGGIRSTGLTAALGIASHVSGKLDPDTFSGETISDPASPTLDRLSNYHPRDWQEEGNGGIVCHCELVTRREINRILDGPLPPNSPSGLKRRTRATMGRCQGFYCTAELTAMTKGRLKHPFPGTAPIETDPSDKGGSHD
ncbi:glycerol-3-phosphate dehydrogenase [Cohaesibacter sp. ES.047]|uniref:NAD(P)/FAD-dependent oxidoreductase n=1 Tax=Cohaesibacter sp. ES.047 TaxID=1798205 RepID=UPI000BB895F7|nr:NAD(P)/FAD-dependent oxidoreductase [Cohaesibacter sp. ES.047]SNY91299.1 glycerol-3-phosphate dehydrogenase [Cohaesibacter sp. ES.047]